MRQDSCLTDVHGAKRLRVIDSRRIWSLTTFRFYFPTSCDEGEHSPRQAHEETDETEIVWNFVFLIAIPSVAFQLELSHLYIFTPFAMKHQI
jgi:hypothetical protein